MNVVNSKAGLCAFYSLLKKIEYGLGTFSYFISGLVMFNSYNTITREKARYPLHI